METGEYLIGTHPDNSKTGKEAAVRMIKVKNIIPNDDQLEDDIEEKLFYALSSKNHRIYKVDEEDFMKTNYNDEKIKKFMSDTDKKYMSYIGYDFGDIIPTNVNGYKNLLEDFLGDDPSDEDMEKGNLVFLGTEPEDSGDPDSNLLVRLGWLLKNPKEGSAMDETVIEKDQFVKCMLIPMENENKKYTIHYINTDGDKTKASVNDTSEIKDMKEELYRMNN